MVVVGRDDNALHWTRESQKGVRSTPMAGRPLRRDGFTVGGSRLELPPTSKFRSGHLPRSTYGMSASITCDDSSSENGVTTESGDETEHGRVRDDPQSLESSPRVHRYSVTDDYQTAAKRGIRRYSSDDYVSSDKVSSSAETLAFRRKNLPSMGEVDSSMVGYSDDEGSDSDSGASSETSDTKKRSIFGVRNKEERLIHESDSYASSDGTKQAILASKNTEGDEVTSDLGNADIQPQSETITGLGDQISSNFSRVAILPDNSHACSTYPTRLPYFHASALGTWHAVVAYDACVRLCLNAWARGCMEAPVFLENECALLREAFGVKNALLQSEEELMANRSSERGEVEVAAPKPKKVVGKMKIEVRKVKPVFGPTRNDNQSSGKLPKVKWALIPHRCSTFDSGLRSSFNSFKKVRVSPRQPVKQSFSQQSLAYVQTSAQYIQQISGLIKTGVTSLRNSSSSYEGIQDSYSCLLRLKSFGEQEAIKMQTGAGDAHIFFPDSLKDELIIHVVDPKGKEFGRILVQLASLVDGAADKCRWLSIYKEPDHFVVGKLQLCVNYSAITEDSNVKCGTVAETVAYDLAMEVAMKIQHFQQRNLKLHGAWEWLLSEFASYYGVSNVYTKLRYLSYVMDVATPTADCLTLVYELLMPVIIKGHAKSALSHQENRILGETRGQIEQLLAVVFENYKSLDESSFSGIMEVFKPPSGIPPPALEPAVKLYSLLHDILSPEPQTNLTCYFQAAAKKRSGIHLAETDEYISSKNDPSSSNPVSLASAYRKMASLCVNIKNEVLTDIEIQNTHVLPSFIDLPNISSAIYSTELCNRLRAFLLAYPPPAPTPPVIELVIATADFQRELSSKNLNNVKGGVDAKELFHLYIMLWMQDKRHNLLESCKLDKVKWSGVRTQHSSTPFIDDMYERLRLTLDDYESIICRWPEYIFVLEQALADVEKAVIEALDKQYADVLTQLKENLAPKKYGFQCIQMCTTKTGSLYAVPDELGILLNSMKRMIDVLRPNLESRFKMWASCIPDGGHALPGERLSEVTVMLRAKFRGYLQSIVEKLALNSKLHNATKMKRILQDSKGSAVESDIRHRMQPLREQIISTVNHLHAVFEPHVFVALCRGYWDRMGQDVLSFLGNRKESKPWCKGSRVAVNMLDDAFASQMQRLLGNSLQDKDTEPPRSITEVRSMLSKDANPTYNY